MVSVTCFVNETAIDNNNEAVSGHPQNNDYY